MLDVVFKYYTELLMYIQYLTWKKWCVFIFLFLISFSIFAINLLQAPEIFPFYKYLLLNYSSYALVIFNGISFALVVGSVYPSIKCIRAKYGESAKIKPFNGDWIFNKPQKWYFSSWVVEDIQGNRHAVITLGSDIKEALRL